MRESKYSIFAPKVRRDIEKKEEKLGRKFTKEEKKEFRQKDIKKLRRKYAVIGILAAIGIGSTVTAIKLLDAPKENNITKIEQSQNKSKGEQFRQSVQHEVEPFVIKENQNEKNITEQITQRYNDTYNEDLSEEDIGYIQSKPQFFKIDESDNYVFDYRENVEAKDYKDNDYNRDTLYIIINKKDNEIISAIGEIDNKIVNVQAKQVMIEDKEYLEGKETINLTVDESGNQKTQKEKDEIFKNVEKAFQDIIEKGKNER